MSNSDIEKIIDDCKLHKCHGIIILSESAEINSNQEQTLKEHEISIVRVKPNAENNYDTIKN